MKMGIGNFVSLLTILLSVSLSSNAQRFPFFRRNRFDGTGEPPQEQSPTFGLPIPNGPFYGQPFDTSATMAGQLPFTVSGKCEEGKVYNVSQASDLLNYRNELECVYSAGLTPKKVPEGSFYGSFLSLINTQLFNSLVAGFWKGKMVTKIDCNGNETFVGWNNMLGTPIYPFIADVKPLDLNLAYGEYYDGKDSLVMDYTKDFRVACPDYRLYLQKNYDSAVIRRRNLNGMYPMNQIVDSVRYVGKQQDNGTIYIGKMYLKDFYRADAQAVTIAYWYTVNYDENASPNFQVGESLPPLERGFQYMHPGSLDLLLRLLPFDNLISSPIRTVGKLARGIWKSGRNSLAYAGERSVGNFMANQRRFRDAFNGGRDFGRRN